MIRDIKDITSFKWATVTGVSPLAIKLDGDSTPLALIPDSLVDPLELAVGDRVRVEMSLRKCVVHGASNGGAKSGEGKVWFGPTAPTGWMLCQGQSLLRSQYPRLFAVIGTVYGAADSTHFNVPDMNGRVLVGRAAGDADFGNRGGVGGAKTHTLTNAEIGYRSYGTVGATGTAIGAHEHGTPNGNVMTPHNNLQPYLVANYIIKI